MMIIKRSEAAINFRVTPAANREGNVRAGRIVHESQVDFQHLQTIKSTDPRPTGVGRSRVTTSKYGAFTAWRRSHEFFDSFWRSKRRAVGSSGWKNRDLLIFPNCASCGITNNNTFMRELITQLVRLFPVSFVAGSLPFDDQLLLLIANIRCGFQ